MLKPQEVVDMTHISFSYYHHLSDEQFKRRLEQLKQHMATTKQDDTQDAEVLEVD